MVCSAPDTSNEHVMIWIRLSDRLGNQMFQYASALGLAARVGAGVEADVGSFANRNSWRHYQLWRFRKLRLGRLVRQCVRTARRPRDLKRLSASGPGFCPELAMAEDDTLLSRFFQSDRHFSAIRDDIQRLFDLSPFLEKRRMAELRRRFASRPLASIHVRRGDYVALSQHNLGELTHYHKRAADAVRAVQPDTAFVVFSDDPAWCRTSKALADLDAFVLDAGAPFADMALMASCQHHIIANSTFSWWAAWLGANPDRRVVFPDRWFRNQKARDLGIVPDHWVEVPVAA